MEFASNFLHEIIDEDIANGLTERIHTRFPPEPNGYLHIGSAKAIYINWSVAQKYNGLFNLRFDDTNPVREDEYVQAILQDVEWLPGSQPSGGIFYGSDYFDKCYECAEYLIKQGKAYVCDLSQEEMRAYRGSLTEPGKNSPYRDRSASIAATSESPQSLRTATVRLRKTSSCLRKCVRASTSRVQRRCAQRLIWHRRT